VIFDRGYPSLKLIYYLLKNGINNIMRCGNFLSEITAVKNSGKKDKVVKISLKRSCYDTRRELKTFFPDIDLDSHISIRVIFVTLKTGEKEVLITSLLDKTLYHYKIFKELYFLRWGIEESYKFLKNVVEIESFSGKTVIAVEQDFHATILAGNMHAL